MVELREETRANTEYIENEGYTVIEMWECQFRQLKKTNPLLRRFLYSEFKRPLDHCWALNEQQILESVVNEKLFGVIELDLRVPESLKEKFGEMCPIFKNTEISREDIGEHMKQFAEENDIMNQPRRSLIGSLKADKVLLATPLLKWYLAWTMG